MSADERPLGLGPGGQQMWDDVMAEHGLSPTQQITLTEACRAKDRSDALAERLVKEPTNSRLITLANKTSDLVKQHLAALRLTSGRRPRVPNGAPPQSRESALERARRSSF